MPDHQDFDDWRNARRAPTRRDVPVPVPLGLVETTAAKHKARFDRWPEGYVEWTTRWAGIPSRVIALVDRLKRDRPWEIFT